MTKNTHLDGLIPIPTKMQCKIQGITQTFQDAAETVAILGTDWAGHFTAKDVKELQAHIRSITRDANKVLDKAAEELET